MKKEIKAKWLKALRSGKYKQTKEKLHRSGGGFCCLGVLTDLYLKEKGITDGWQKTERGSSRNVKVSKKGSYYSEVFTPKVVQKWAGLSSNNPICDGKTLSDWNDSTRVGFKGIAKLISKHL